AAPEGRHDVGRRAADGRDRPCADDIAPAHPARRAVARPRAEVRHVDLRQARRAAARGYTLMLVEQNAARALQIADRAYVLELGRNRFEGGGTALLADPEVKRLYLGG